MALEQTSPGGYRLRRTIAVATLDPSEKGAVNYFLGLVFCKLFAAKLLDTPWLLHLDVFRPFLNPQLRGRSRPDLVGMETGSSDWHAFECKGRISAPDSTAKTNAKDQALRLVSVNGTPCRLHVGAITYFRNDVLNVYWRDPAPKDKSKIEVTVTADAWRYYYAPVLELLGDRLTTGPTETTTLLSVEELDVQLGIHPALRIALLHHEWGFVQSTAMKASREFSQRGFQPDGIIVKAGDSWRQPFEGTSLNEG
jgi:hypothetical protein